MKIACPLLPQSTSTANCHLVLQPAKVAVFMLLCIVLGIVHCGQTIVNEEGVRALWKGLTPFATHLTLKYALRMGSNSVYQVSCGKAELVSCCQCQDSHVSIVARLSQQQHCNSSSAKHMLSMATASTWRHRISWSVACSIGYGAYLLTVACFR
jgi:hypothetical protein